MLQLDVFLLFTREIRAPNPNRGVRHVQHLLLLFGDFPHLSTIASPYPHVDEGQITI